MADEVCVDTDYTCADSGKLCKGELCTINKQCASSVCKTSGKCDAEWILHEVVTPCNELESGNDKCNGVTCDLDTDCRT